jgi:transposase
VSRRRDADLALLECRGGLETAFACALKSKCTLARQRRVKRWEHEAVLDAMRERLDRAPKTMRIRRQTAEHPFGTIKAWMGATHFRLRTLKRSERR